MVFGVNLKDYIEYDYSESRSCEESGCYDEICRCSKIYDTVVNNVNIGLISKYIKDINFNDAVIQKRNNFINSLIYRLDDNKSWMIDHYIIDRVLRINKIYNKNVWNFNIINGYYGQEIESITIEDSVAKIIDEQIENALDLLDLKLVVEYLLELEYGYILPELKDCSYEIILIDSDDITFGNTKYHERILSEKSFYTFKGIGGIVKRKDGKFYVIDGYHRLSSEKFKSVIVINAY